MNQTRIPQKSISFKERWISLFLLSLLIFIVGAIWVLQYRYDAGEWRERSNEEALVVKAGGGQEEIAGLIPLSSTEQYDAVNLSDKINGKAELYLTAGFKKLESRRFGFSSDPGRWMERYVYHMAEHRSAFAVFSAQRRSNVEPLKLGGGGDAYVAANGLFVVHGPFYLEIIAAEDSDEMRAKALDLARTFIAKRKVAFTPLRELAIFPDRGRLSHTRVLVADDAFGMDGLDWVFTGRYEEAGQEATAFVSRRDSVAEADDLARAFFDYWRDYGGEAVVLPEAWADYRTITILDNYEMVRVEGKYLIGVHEATDLDFGLRLLRQLRQRVREIRHEP